MTQKDAKVGPSSSVVLVVQKRQTLKMMCSEDDRDDPLTRFQTKKKYELNNGIFSQKRIGMKTPKIFDS